MYIDDEIKTLFQNAVPANNNLKKKQALRINKKRASYFITPLILSALLGTLSFVSEKTPNFSLFSSKSDESNQAKQFITVKQSNEIKHIVKKVALYEKKHPNSIHNELKRLFGYNSYKSVTYDIYLKILPYLKQRLN